jgi:hypothetical protein
MPNLFNPLLWLFNAATAVHAKHVAKHLREELAADVAKRVVAELEKRYPPKRGMFANHRQQVDW